MLDVIVPTILNTKMEVFLYMLEQMQECEAVKNVFVIDNTDDNAFSRVCRKNLSKVITVNGAGKNLYVNGAWNLGMRMCRSENYCIINDDILITSEMMLLIDEALNKNPDISLLTVKTENNVPLVDYLKTESGSAPLEYTEDIPNAGRQGWIMFGRKSEWREIPNLFRLYYGDDLIFKWARARGKVLMITNHYISHFISSSINGIFNKIHGILLQDNANWARYKNDKIS
jgi:hypothetical protein